MKFTDSNIRRIEAGVGCIVGAIGYAICGSTHNCMCGHLAHGQYASFLPWVVHGTSLFAFLTVVIVGIRGGFPWSIATSMVAGLIVPISFLLLPFGSMAILTSIPFLLIGALHLIFALRDSRRSTKLTSIASSGNQEAEQLMDVNRP